MANRGGHPGRTLIIFGVIVAALFGLMAISNNWTPKLGLDLQGGTTDHPDGPEHRAATGQIDPNSLQLARTIIQSRVDSLGVGETEVTTSGDRQIIVSVPNVQQDELVRLVGQTAVLRFRAVYAAEAVTASGHAVDRAERFGHADHRALGGRRRATEPSAGAPSASPSGDRPTGSAAADRPAGADHARGRPRPVRARRRTRRSTGSRARPTRPLRRVHLRPDGRVPGRLRPAAGRLQPGEDREVPARPDADRGHPADHAPRPASRRTRSSGW